MNFEKKLLKIAQLVLLKESEAIKGLIGQLDNNFIKAIHFLSKCSGKIIFTGVGKSALVAQKTAATFNSTGTPALFLHASDAIHGDIGVVDKKDVVFIISKSGDTPEIKALLPYFVKNNIPILAMVQSAQSSLVDHATHSLIFAQTEEADPNLLAPSTSTVIQMAIGDALAFCLADLKEFKTDDFLQLHSGGILGKQLYLTVGQMAKQNLKPVVLLNTPIKEIIIEITSNRLGATAVTDENGLLCGIITDGDLRRMLNQYSSFEGLYAEDIMTSSPKTLAKDALAMLAFDEMKKNSITQIIVTEEDRYIGIVHIHDIIKEGLV